LRAPSPFLFLNPDPKLAANHMNTLNTTGVQGRFDKRLLVLSTGSQSSGLKAGPLLLSGLVLTAAATSLFAAPTGTETKGSPPKVLILRGAAIFDAQRGE